jgi:hypothetical protein
MRPLFRLTAREAGSSLRQHGEIKMKLLVVAATVFSLAANAQAPASRLSGL